MENEAKNIDNTDTLELQKPHQKFKKWLKEAGKEILYFLAIAVFIILPFRAYVAEPYVVEGRSMSPTFSTGDYLIVNKFSYLKKSPERNTVIVFKFPLNPKRNFIKRVIGLPNETIILKDNEVKIINKENPEGFVLDEVYVLKENELEMNLQVTLKENEYFVMGDNRKESFDSRMWGVLPKKYILGEPILRLLPFTEAGYLPGK